MRTWFFFDATTGRATYTVVDLDGDDASSTPSGFDGGDSVTLSCYTAAGRLEKRITAHPGASASYAFPTGDQCASMDSALVATVYSYDDAGQMETTTDPMGRVSTTAYDGEGRVQRQTRELGGYVEYGYDDAGRVVTTTTPTAFGSPDTTVTATRGYTLRGELAFETDPFTTPTPGDPASALAVTDDSTRYYRYDPAGRLARVIDANGATDPYNSGDYWGTDYTYDSRGNRLSRTVGTTTGDVTDLETSLAAVWTQSWAYDLADHLTVEVPLHRVGEDPPGTREYFYDGEFGRLVKVEENNQADTLVMRSSEYEYWNSGQVKNRVDNGLDPSESALPTYEVDFWYDAAGRMTTADDVATEDGSSAQLIDVAQAFVNRPGIRGGSLPLTEDESYEDTGEIEADQSAVLG